MKNIIKNTRGAALAVVIIIFAVVSIVGTTVLSVSLSQTTSSEAAEDTTAAYYYARSAVEIVSSNIEDKYDVLTQKQAAVAALDGSSDEETVNEAIDDYNNAVAAFNGLKLIPASAAETCRVDINGILANPVTVLIKLVSSGGSNVIELSSTVTYEGNTSSARAQIGTFAQTQATVGFSTTSTSYGPFGYGIFSDSSIEIEVNNLTVNGDVHTNGSYTVLESNNLTHNGSVEAVTSYWSDSNNTTITGTCRSPSITAIGHVNIAHQASTADVIAMPDFSDSLDKVIAIPDGTWQHYVGNKKYGKNTTIDKPLYVEGDLEFSGNTNIDKPLYVEGHLEFSGTGTVTVEAPIYVDGNITIGPNNFTTTHPVIATGNITIDTNNVSGKWFYSTNGDITVEANNLSNGLIYAPNGTIDIQVNNLVLNGRIVGKALTFDANNITINTSPNDLNVLSEVIETTTQESVEYTVYTPVYNRIWLR